MAIPPIANVEIISRSATEDDTIQMVGSFKLQPRPPRHFHFGPQPNQPSRIHHFDPPKVQAIPNPQFLARELWPRGIHVAHIVLDGGFADPSLGGMFGSLKGADFAPYTSRIRVSKF
jgi:hypothetical protein